MKWMWFTLLAEKVPPACFGGVARLFNTVKEIKADEENVIFLNGGDMFQGNVWYSQFKWRVIAQFTNYLNFTASVSISQEKGIKLNSIISCLLYIRLDTRNLSLLYYWLQSPGNHEFDDKISGFSPFVENITYPMVCANCDFGSYPELQILIKPYVTKEVGGRKIGIIGFLTTDTGVSATQLL